MELLKAILINVLLPAVIVVVIQWIITVLPHELRDNINGIPVECYQVSFLLYPDPLRTHFHCKSIRGE